MNNEELREFFKRYQQTYPAPARLDYYLKAAQARKENATDSETEIIRILEHNIEEAELAIEKRDIDLFAQAFERVIRRTVELNLIEYETYIISKQGAKGGDAKAAIYAQLEKLAIKLYQEQGWNSMRAASKSPDLQNPINSLADKLGVSHPAQRTIEEEWLPKKVKNKT